MGRRAELMRSTVQSIDLDPCKLVPLYQGTIVPDEWWNQGTSYTQPMRDGTRTAAHEHPTTITVLRAVNAMAKPSLYVADYARIESRIAAHSGITRTKDGAWSLGGGMLFMDGRRVGRVRSDR